PMSLRREYWGPLSAAAVRKVNQSTLWTKAVAVAAALGAATVLFAAPAQAGTAPAQAKSAPAPAADKPAKQPVAPDEYIVTLRDAEGLEPDAIATKARGLSRQFDGALIRSYKHALKGFVVKMPAGKAAALAKHPAVRSVNPNRVGSLAACDPDPCSV